jgi:hypothetical protein
MAVIDPVALQSLAAALRDESFVCDRLGDPALQVTPSRIWPIFHLSNLPFFRVAESSLSSPFPDPVSNEALDFAVSLI